MADLAVFEKLFARIEAVTQGTRNGMVLHLKIYTLQGADHNAADERARIIIARRLLAENPAFHVPEAFDILEHGQERMVLRKALTDSAAYDSSELMDRDPSEEADSIVADFFALFDSERTTFLGTSSWGGYPEFKPRDSEGISGPLTGATFESGLIAIDSEKLAYIWIEEED